MPIRSCFDSVLFLWCLHCVHEGQLSHDDYSLKWKIVFLLPQSGNSLDQLLFHLDFNDLKISTDFLCCFFLQIFQPFALHTVNPFIKNSWVMRGNADGHKFICRPGVQPRFLLTACSSSHLTAVHSRPSRPCLLSSSGFQTLLVGAPPVEPRTGMQWALGFHPKPLVD